MKIKAIVQKTKTTPDGMFALLKFNGKLPKDKTTVTVTWGPVRSLKQNNLYWQLLTWLCEEGGMRDQGYLFKEDLHEVLKGRLLSKEVTSKGGFTTIKIKSTTELRADEFMNYIEQVEHLLTEYCKVDFSPFWTEYAQEYASK